jgi:hypothetical protein
MACGGCAARRQAIAGGVKALARGDVKAAVDQSHYIVKSARDDAVAAFRSKISTARARLTKR